MTILADVTRDLPTIRTQPQTPEAIRAEAAKRHGRILCFDTQLSPDAYAGWCRAREFDALLIAACDAVYEPMQRRVSELERQLAYARLRLGRYCDANEALGGGW